MKTDMMVLNEFGSAFDALRNRTVPETSMTSVKSERSPSKSSTTHSSYSSSSSSSSSSTSPTNVNANEQSQCFGMEGCDGPMLSPFPVRTDVAGFSSIKGEQMSLEPTPNGIYAQFHLLNDAMTAAQDPGGNSRARMHNYDCQNFDTTPPHSSSDVAFFGALGADSQMGDVHHQHQPVTPRKTFEHVTDKELRKKLKNRESAQAARDRKKAKMMNLERQISELLDRNRVVETENHKLRIRIQQLESDAYWRQAKQDTTSAAAPGLPAADTSALQQHYPTEENNRAASSPSFPGNQLAQHYNQSDPYSIQCSYGANPFQQQPQQHHQQAVAISSHDGGGGEKRPFQIAAASLGQDPVADEFGPGTFAQNIWENDTIRTALANDGSSPYALNCGFGPGGVSVTSAGEGVLG